MKRNQSIIIMTMILGLLIMPLYLISFNRQQFLLFGLIYLLDRVISIYTGGMLSEALNTIEQKVDDGIDDIQSKNFSNFLVWMIGAAILAIIIYVYILVTNLPLFIILMSGEILDKGIEFLLNKMKGMLHK